MGAYASFGIVRRLAARRRCALSFPRFSRFSRLSARARAAAGGLFDFDLSTFEPPPPPRAEESSRSSQCRVVVESGRRQTFESSRARHVPPGSHLLFLLRYTQTKTILIIPFYLVMLFTHQIEHVFKLLDSLHLPFDSKNCATSFGAFFSWRFWRENHCSSLLGPPPSEQYYKAYTIVLFIFIDPYQAA